MAHPCQRPTMKEEMNALTGKGTWKLESLYFDKEVVKYKWVFFIKYQHRWNNQDIKRSISCKTFQKDLWY